MQERSKMKMFWCFVLAILITLSPSVQQSRSSVQSGQGQGSSQRNDPCDHLPEPTGKAPGIEKLCPELGGSSGVAKGDFNGDGFADLAVGVPGSIIRGGTNAGSVRVFYGSGTGLTATGSSLPPVPAPQFFSQDNTNVPGVPEKDDKFGSALAAGDFNGDGFSDLAIGVPGEDVTFQNTNFQDWGAIDVIYGSRAGLTTTDSSVPAPQTFNLSQHFFQRDGHAAAGARLGQALSWGDFNGDGSGDLVIGAPNYTLDRGFFGGQISETGAVWILLGIKKTTSTLGGLTTASNLLLMRDDLPDNCSFSDFVCGTSLPGDHFGAALTAGDFNGDTMVDLAIGIPDKQVQFTSFFFLGVPVTKQDADGGAFVTVSGSSVGLDPATVRNFRCCGPSTGRLGAALAAGDFNGDGKADLAVSQPIETRDDVSNALIRPFVEVLPGTSSGLFLDLGFVGPLTIHAGDIIPNVNDDSRFGAALAAGDFNADGKIDLAIGVPFADIKTLVSGVNTTLDRAGEVDVIYGSSSGLSLTVRPAQRWNQDTATYDAGTNQVQPLSAAAGNRFGASLTAWNFGRNETIGVSPPFILKQTADLAIGIPFANVNGLSNAGAVAVMYGSAAFNGLTGVNAKGLTNNKVFTEATISGAVAQAEARFGAALY